MTIIRIKRSKIPPKRRGPTMDVVEKEILSLAIEMSEKNKDLPSHTWRTRKGAKFGNFDRGVLMGLSDSPVEAFGLWSVAAGAVQYAKLLSASSEGRESMPTRVMMKTHRLLYAISQETYKKPFVGLDPKQTIEVMKLAQKELGGLSMGKNQKDNSPKLEVSTAQAMAYEPQEGDQAVTTDGLSAEQVQRAKDVVESLGSEVATPETLGAELSETLYQRVERYTREAAATEGNSDPLVLYLGLVGEVGEMLDYIKKVIAHGKPYNGDVLEKECGDACWYVAAIQRKYGRKGSTSLDPFYIVANLDEAIVMLAQQVAGCHPNFMTCGDSFTISGRLERIMGLIATVFAETEIRVGLREDTGTHYFVQDLRSILDANAEKLTKRYPDGFTPQASAERVDAK